MHAAFTRGFCLLPVVRDALLGCWLIAHGLTALADTHYVDIGNPTPVPPYTNWVSAATNIQDAVDVAESNDVVLVTNGVYDTGTRVTPGYSLMNRVVVTNAITLRSVNGPASTSIKGKGPLGSNAVRCVYLGTNVVLDGFTLTNGYTWTTTLQHQNESGGGAFADGATLTNCWLLGNSANGYGGGAYCGVLYDCRLTDNWALFGGGGGRRVAAFDSVFARNSTSVDGGGVIASVLTNCVLSSNVARRAGAALDSDLYRCILVGNTADQFGGGTWQGTLYNCAIVGNKALGNVVGGHGGGTRDSTLYNCTVVGNHSDQGWGGGVANGDMYNCVAYHNTAEGAPFNIGSADCYDSCSPDLTHGMNGNITNAPLFVNTNNWADLSLQFGSPCIDAGSNQAWMVGNSDLAGNQRIWNGTVDMGAYEYHGPGSTPIHYVSLSGGHVSPFIRWIDAATNIQDAVDVAESNDVVLVTNGVYDTGTRVTPGTSQLNRVVITNAITLRSVSGPEATIIKGQGPVGSNAVRCVYLSASALLDGFTVTNGHVAGSGGGVLASDGIVSNCILTGNSATKGGGSYGATLYDCAVVNNFASGIAGGAYSGTMYRCSFSSNTSPRVGGVLCGTLYSCTLFDNEGGASAGGARESDLYNCKLLHNEGKDGAAHDCRLYSCILAGNTAYQSGGGAYHSKLYSCVVVGNTAVAVAGGAGWCEITNTIVYYNAAPTDSDSRGSTCRNSCSPVVTNGVNGNITNAPLFADTNNWANLRLLPGSPCIDTGTNQVWMTNALDLAGNPRIHNGTVDMGAYESLDHWLDVETSGFGGVNVTDRWYTNASVVALTASPSDYWYFSAWSNDLSGPNTTTSLVMNADKLVTAWFAPYLTTNAVPHWWLAAYGLATNDAAAMSDSDADGALAWQEYFADTAPTNGESVLRITGIESTGTTATVSWQGGAASRQYLERRLDLVSTSDQWQAIHTNAPVTPVTNFFADPAATNGRLFYRVRVERP